VAARRSGILCHPTCVPGPHGIGDLGDGLWRFLSFLASAGQTLWQVLPLGPTGYGDSPYQPFSAFAGNPLLISLERLVEEGLLSSQDLSPQPEFSPDRVDYGRVIGFKMRALRRSWERFLRDGDRSVHEDWYAYVREQAHWLDDYALFMALKERFGWAPWTAWPEDIALHREDAVAHWVQELADEVDLHRYMQFLFARQWRAVRNRAHELGICIMGDVPIFVAHDSADVWGRRDLFDLDGAGHPRAVAGVPPDYFSSTGQLWGNPLYRWDVMRDRGYSWWLARLERVVSLVDVVRLDHFRGFCGYWEVPADHETAAGGRWVRGPGRDLFDAIEERLGSLPIVAEDLGVISEDVIALRESLGVPGMRVLQFGFHGAGTDPHLPHNYDRDVVAYTATHDNDTTVGWYRAQDEQVRHRARLYSGSHGEDIAWAFVRLVSNSVADWAVFPLQDALGLGSEARMNQPGRGEGNWTWRYREEALTDDLATGLRDLAHACGRWAEPGTEMEGPSPPVIEYEDPTARHD